MFIPQEVIRKKRDNQILSGAEIQEFVGGMTSQAVTEAQIAALAMAIFFQGMNRSEVVTLTQAMKNSGVVLDWDLPGPVCDKHSTGGVGDVVSLMLGPILAAAGAYVPMLSGRGLGHTGGTLDKLDSIPGYNTQPEKELFRQVVKQVGVAIIGQTSDLAPADKIFYAVRDTTATVETIPLITASILSKKMAAGLDYLVVDVKTGSGAFMPSPKLSRQLAESIVVVANGAGLKTRALLTDMQQSLAPCAGNSLEVQAALRYLCHNESRTGDLQQLHLVTRALCAQALLLCGLVPDEARGEQRVEELLSSGKAAEKFAQMVVTLGGPSDFLEAPTQYLPDAQIIRPIYPESDTGLQVQAINTRGLGMAVVALGGGRTRASDPIDFSVGLSTLAMVGDTLVPDQPLALAHANSEAAFAEAENRVRQAYQLGIEPGMRPQAIYEAI